MLTFNVDRIDEIEREVKHDVIAFLTHLQKLLDLKPDLFIRV